MNLPELKVSVGSIVWDDKREVRILDYKLPEPHDSAINVLVKDIQTGKEYWVSASWLH